MEDLYEKEHELLRLLCQNTSLQALCDKMAELIGNPIAVGDFFRNKIVLSKHFPEDDFEDQLNRLNHMPKDSRQSILERMFYWLQDRKPRIVELTYMRKRRLCCGIFFHEQLVAFLETPDTGAAFEAIDEDFYRSCSDVMGLALHFSWFPTDKALRHPYTLLWNHFNLSSEHKHNEDWSFCTEFAAIGRYQLFWTDSAPAASAFFEAVDCLSFRHWALPIADGTLYLADADAPDLCVKLHELALDCGVAVGASCVFTDLNDLDDALRQARCSCSYSRQAGKKTGLSYYNDCKLQDLLSQAGKHIPLLPFCDDVLMQIRDHDRAHQTEYERTLRVYLMNGQSIQAAASILFVHKNTVLYRVGKLRELFGIRFGDSRQLSQLFCSFLIMDGACAADMLAE